MNLRTQQAVCALKPAKELAEYAISDIYTMFLLWAHYTENSIKGYGVTKADAGQQYEIAWNEITPEAIYLSVELKPDVPTDRQQRANTAMLLLQRPGFYSKERALSDMGVTDPEQVMKDSYFEQLLDAEIANYIQLKAAEAQMGLQQMAQQAQMAQQEQAQQTLQNEQAGAPGGPGFDPNQGGLPPQQAAPGATFEGVTGTDRQGAEAPQGRPI